jgi:hypothetical protein
MGGLGRCPARGLWVLIVGWISGKDPTYPEATNAWDTLWDRGTGGEL